MLKDLLSIAVLSAEQAGFENGVRFAAKILYLMIKEGQLFLELYFSYRRHNTLIYA